MLVLFPVVNMDKQGFVSYPLQNVKTFSVSKKPKGNILKLGGVVDFCFRWWAFLSDLQTISCFWLLIMKYFQT